MKKFLFSLTTLSLALTIPFSFAEQSHLQQTENTVIQLSSVEVVDTVTGVSYEVDANGEFTRIRAIGEAELEFGDRKDIRIATQKATMRAKANIAKFLSERVTSDEVMDNVENVATKTENGNKTANRETVSNYLEKIHNSAEALLKGVIATKTDVNKDEKYVQVELGISKKTMAAADTLNKGLRIDSTEQTPSGNGTSIESNGGGREIKKSKNYDNF